MTPPARSASMRLLSLFSRVGAASPALLPTDIENVTACASVVRATLLMAHGLAAAKNSRRAQTERDRRELDEVHALATQCIKIAEMAARPGARRPEEVSRALARLAAKTGLLATRYGTHFDPQTAEMIRGADQMAVLAHAGGNADPRLPGQLLWRLQGMRAAVPDIGSPHLCAVRRHI